MHRYDFFFVIFKLLLINLFLINYDSSVVIQFGMSFSEVLNNKSLSVFLQNPKQKHSVNAMMVANGWAKATGIGYVMVS